MNGEPEPARLSLGALFRACLVIGATSIGGGASAYIHDVFVNKKKWLGERRSLEALSLARSLPGPNVTNLAAFLGASLRGPLGAACAFAGVSLPGAIFVLGLAAGYGKLAALQGQTFQHALHGLSAGAVGVMASLLLQAAPAGLRARGGAVVALAAFAAIVLLGLNMLVVVAVLVPVAGALNRGEKRG